MYELSAAYYDRIYSWKNYPQECERLRAIVDEHLRSDRIGSERRLLDVACGTAEHLRYLRDDFTVEGVDLMEEFLAITRAKLPDIAFHQGDMRTLALGRRFDVVTCLFSAIGYMTTLDDLHRAVAAMSAHLAPGGLLVVEPWFTPDAWRSGTPHMLVIDEPDFKLARVNTSLTRDRLAVMEMHHLVGTPEKTVHFVEHHELLLAEIDELLEAFRAAGLEPWFDREGVEGRGLVIGRA